MELQPPTRHHEEPAIPRKMMRRNGLCCVKWANLGVFFNRGGCLLKQTNLSICYQFWELLQSKVDLSGDKRLRLLDKRQTAICSNILRFLTLDGVYSLIERFISVRGLTPHH